MTSKAPRFVRRRLAAVAPLALVLAGMLASPALANEQQLGFDGSDLLGFAVAQQGDTLVLGAPGDAKLTGAVYVFQRQENSWVQTGKLTVSDGSHGDVLGGSVAIDGDTIVAGAPGDSVEKNATQGSAYTFARTGPAER